MTIQRPITRNAVQAAVAMALAGGMHTALAQDSGRVLEEITVTASKREESIQDVAASVTALGAAQIKDGGIDDISRLEHLVPGLRFGQSGNEVRLAMRGTRTNNVGTEAEQVVGIFEDGVYVPTTTQALGSYVDVQRIEVLRGPQGTLYGRNTFGGTINIVTNQPTFDGVHGYVHGVYGDYNRTKLEGVVNIPFSDTWAMRLVGMVDSRDGYIENTWVDGESDDLSDDNVKFGRATLRWQPNDRFDGTLRLSYMDRSNNGNAIWGYQQIAGYVGGELRQGHQYAPADATARSDEGPWKIARNMASNADTESLSATLDLNFDVGIGNLRWINNITDFDGSQNYDPDYSDGGDPLNAGFTGWVSKQDTVSSELQLVSNGGEKLDWLLGLYYFEQTAAWNWLERVDGVTEVPHWDRIGDYKSDSFGAFGQATYSVTDRARITAGLRYARDSKGQKDQLDWSVFPPVQSPGTGEKGEWNKTLWKLGFEYDINDQVLTYITASTGYRAGGTNSIAPDVPETYDPETVTAYEAGFKSTLADGAMQLNVAAYLNQYRDMQAQSFIVGPSGGVDEFTENGGELDAQGLEVEFTWLPTDNWNIGATLALMDAEFGEYNISKVAGLGDLGGRQDLADPNAPLLSLRGWEPALAPSVTAGLQLSYDFLFAGGSSLRPFVQTTYTSKYSAADINVEGQFQDAHTKTDLRLVWTSSDGALEVQGFVLNAENEAVLNRVVIFNPGGTTDLASLQANWNVPRTWGVSATWNFE